MNDPVDLTGLCFGMMLPVQAQSTLMREDWETTAGPSELATVACVCDDAGIDVVGVCDHVAIPRDRAEAMSTVWYDTVSTLSWLAGMTTRVRLMSMVYVVSYRHPLQTAKAFSTLDAISGGRAVLGVGAGHVEGEFEVLGVPFRERGRRTDDAIVAVRAALADEFGNGTHGQRPRPVQPSGPPIWVGGSSMPALRRAARLGDGWLPQGPPGQGMAQAIADLHRLRDEAGRGDVPFGIGGGISCYVGDPGRPMPDWMVTGPPERIAEAIRAQHDLGVSLVQLRIPSRTHTELIDQIQSFTNAVAPLARS